MNYYGEFFLKLASDALLAHRMHFIRIGSHIKTRDSSLFFICCISTFFIVAKGVRDTFKGPSLELHFHHKKYKQNNCIIYCCPTLLYSQSCQDSRVKITMFVQRKRESFQSQCASNICIHSFQNIILIQPPKDY